MKATDEILFCRACNAETLHAKKVIGRFPAKRIDDAVVKRGIGRAAKITQMRCVECVTRGGVNA